MHVHTRRNTTHARCELRETAERRVAWKAAASGGELHPGALLDLSSNRMRLAVRMSETPIPGTVIKALLRGERYPVHYRVVRAERGAPGCAEVACERVSGSAYRAARSNALHRTREARGLRACLSA